MRRVLLAVFSTIAGLVMLLSFKTQAVGTAALPAAVGTGAPVDPTPAPTASTSPTAAAAGVSGTYTGTAADTRYGPVQVRITVVNGTVTAAEAVDYPTGNGRDQEINARAVPELNQEAVQAGARIDTVSGATYTSDGYAQSLQSALDQAGL